MPRKRRWRSQVQKKKRTLRERKLVAAMADLGNKSVRAAARRVGIHENTAYATLKQPHVQNMLTEALARANVTPDKIVAPIVKGLEAKRILHVKNKDTGDVDLITDEPDYAVQFAAHDRAVNLHALGGKHLPDAGGQAPADPRPVMVNVVFVDPPTREAVPKPGVKFIDPSQHR